MLFLGRLLLYAGVIAGIAFAGLYALGTMVVPEQREITLIISAPRTTPPAPKG